MRKYLSGGALIALGIAGIAMGVTASAAAPPGWFFVCHQEGSDYRIIQVKEPAVGGHLDHGDPWAVSEDASIPPCPGL